MDNNLTTSHIATTGDARRMILDTIVELRRGDMPAATGMAIAANMKVLNDSIQVEINAAKLSLQTEGRAHAFGNIVQMGQRLIGS
jgi:hypothetical protein